MTTRIRRALEAVADMSYPSVADLLDKHGYIYEAAQVQELLDAWNEYIREQAPT